MDKNNKKILTFSKFSNTKKLVGDKITNKSKLLNDSIVKFLNNLKKESSETSDAARILKDYALGKKVSKKDMDSFREQMIDILKILGIGIPFVIIPGASLLLPIVLKVAKKYNIDILPSSFKEDKNKKSP